MILVGSSCLLSCFSDKEQEVVVYQETTITNMQLSAVNRKIHTTTAKGKDTTYVKKLTTFPIMLTARFSIPTLCPATATYLTYWCH